MKPSFFNTLRKKALLMILLFAFSMVATRVILMQNVLLNSFIRLENQQTMSELKAVLGSLDTEVARINSVAGD